jgi:uncharacterized protein YggE
MENNLLPKWLVSGLGGLLIVFVAILVVQKSYDLNASFKNQRPANTISVSGMGKVSAVPDLATVSIGVQSQAASATDVKNQNNDKVNKVIAFIKSQGLDDKDIKTSDYSLQPQYQYSTNGKPSINSYTLNQSVVVKVHGVDKNTDTLNKIIDGAVNAGANQVYGSNLSVEDPSSLQEKAQESAIADAKQKAEKLAKAAGLTLGKVVSVSEAGAPRYPGPIPYALDSFAGQGSAKSVAPDIQTGSQEISETMTVIFEVK